MLNDQQNGTRTKCMIKNNKRRKTLQQDLVTNLQCKSHIHKLKCYFNLIIRLYLSHNYTITVNN